MSYRGRLTPEVEKKMKLFLGRETSQRELRLYPYLQYQMMNEQRIDPRKIDAEERKILSLLRKDCHIDGGASGLAMTREFFDFINDILWDTYVAYE